MKRIIAVTAAGLSLLSTKCIANDYGLPQEYWEFMDGYRYEYLGCSVGWSGRTASFLVHGDSCENVSSKKMSEDAIKSIAYLKKNSGAPNFYEYYERDNRATRPYSTDEANRDAQKIWQSGCSDFKNGMNAGDFREWLKLGDAAKTYPRIRDVAVNKLYMDGWDIARGLGGVIKCQEMALYRAADYVSGTDIRKP